MTIYLDKCTGNPSADDIEAVRATLQTAFRFGQNEEHDSWIRFFEQLHRVFPSVNYRTGGGSIHLLLDGADNGRSVYVSTRVRVVDVEAEG